MCAQFTVLTRVAQCHWCGTSPPDGTAITAHSRVSRVGRNGGVARVAVEPEKEIVSRYESRQWRRLATSPNGWKR
jgi:hypothetical protein